MAETKSTCCCGGVAAARSSSRRTGAVTGVRGDPDNPANFGRLCTKGATLHLSAGHNRRALHPELRTTRVAPRARVSWDEALDHAADRFASVIRVRPRRGRVYVSRQLRRG